MTLNHAKGRMFKSVGWTWNPIAGCTHDCKYCWAKSLNDRWGKSFEPQLREHFFKDKMPNDGSWIFVGSMGDVFCFGVPSKWIMKIINYIERCEADNRFLLQTKNPFRFHAFFQELDAVKDKIILGTTVETTYETPWSRAPPTYQRIVDLGFFRNSEFDTFLSLEPLADFNLNDMMTWMLHVEPLAVEIGTVNYCDIPKKPKDEKIMTLVEFLKDVKIDYILKENLQYIENKINNHNS